MMRESQFKNNLKKASAYQYYKTSPNTKRANEAREKFEGKKILPLIIFMFGVKSYIDQKISRYKQHYRDRDHEELEKDALNANNKIANFTVVIAIVAFASAYFSWKTLNAIEGQLTEMKGSGQQTDKIIEADNNLASAARDQASAQKINVELSQRAWVGPFDAKIEGIVKGKIVKGIVLYQNTGRQPAALNMAMFQIWYKDKEAQKSREMIISNQEACIKMDAPASGQTAFPIQNLTNYYVARVNSDYSETPVNVVDDDVLQGKTTIVIAGCFIYRSFDKSRHSYFSYIYNAKTAPETEHLSFYPASYAD